MADWLCCTAKFQWLANHSLTVIINIKKFWIFWVPAEGEETTSWSDDLVVALVKHGFIPSRTTSNIWTWGCGRPSTELMTVICGVISWKRRRSCRGMLHDDDDDEAFTVFFLLLLLW